ncbi:hypothetical protein ACFPOE_05315 [Caenimonas terrae]|uniref:Uncharacterized protein n=1 Tax=Caenimonas terrae TaxID=696074 RepID=A0ABW0NAN1_9BURK
MHSIRKIPAGAALLAACASALAHDAGGWAAIHWHASDVLGVAVVSSLCVAAVWLARRDKRAARQP